MRDIVPSTIYIIDSSYRMFYDELMLERHCAALRVNRPLLSLQGHISWSFVRKQSDSFSTTLNIDF